MLLFWSVHFLPDVLLSSVIVADIDLVHCMHTCLCLPWCHSLATPLLTCTCLSHLLHLNSLFPFTVIVCSCFRLSCYLTVCVWTMPRPPSTNSGECMAHWSCSYFEGLFVLAHSALLIWLRSLLNVFLNIPLWNLLLLPYLEDQGVFYTDFIFVVKYCLTSCT